MATGELPLNRQVRLSTALMTVSASRRSTHPSGSSGAAGIWGTDTGAEGSARSETIRAASPATEPKTLATGSASPQPSRTAVTNSHTKAATHRVTAACVFQRPPVHMNGHHSLAARTYATPSTDRVSRGLRGRFLPPPET